MSVVFYWIGVRLYGFGIFISSLFNEKAKKWIAGRRDFFELLEQKVKKNTPRIWIHAASLGEYEQGRPIAQKLLEIYPHYEILTTFFSPSGYEAVHRKYPDEHILYLPLDGPRNARKFLEIVQPNLAIFIKYEFWYFFLRRLKEDQVPVILVSGKFRQDQPFFKLYGKLFRRMLQSFNHLFVQDEESKRLLQSVGVRQVTVSGDTRFERVLEVKNQAQRFKQVEFFLEHHPCFIAGSTWPQDEKLLVNLASSTDPKVKFIIVPHEVGEDHIDEVSQKFPQVIRFSLLTEGNSGNKRTLVVDAIGMLSSLYHYGTIAYVGGGFGKGIHNVLEAAVYGIPVIIGPNYRKFKEANDLVATGGVFVINNETELRDVVQRLLTDKEFYDHACRINKEYVYNNAAASQPIISFIVEKQLLTHHV